VTSQLSFLTDPIDQAFLSFHHANPHVYRTLVGLARKWKDAGHDRCSMNMLFEVLRWDEGLRTQSADGLKLNNNFRSRYSRLVAANHPDLAHLFETLALASERGAA
jgi:hypothetical protein